MIENKPKKKPMIGIFIVIVLLVGAVAVLANTDIFKNEPIVDDGDPYSTDPYGSAKIPAELFQPESYNDTIAEFLINPVWNELTQDYRPRWLGCTDEEFKQIFGNLPKMPQDFYKKYQMFQKGEITDYDRLEEKYWKQPEFYGLQQIFFDSYYRRNPTTWRPGKVSCKPMYRYVEVKPGANVEISTFFHTEVIGSEAYLGAIAYVHLPDVAMLTTGATAYEQPNNADDYISAKITQPDNDPIFMDATFQENINAKGINIDDDERMLLFHAGYKRIDYQGIGIIEGFPDGWCHRVTCELDISNNCPPGDYVVAVDIRNPYGPITEEYNWVISGEPYYAFFLPAIREWRPITPYFQIILTVVK